ncbi:hypothetical protein [Leucobacter soli]|uniref:hypothetical protein n=1 Tax=Leucobacter soli TaxID=2812850 RepID=UPI00361F16AB
MTLLGATEGGGPIVCDQDTGICSNVVAAPVSVDAETGWGAEQTIAAVAIALLASVVLVPPMAARLVRERRRA